MLSFINMIIQPFTDQLCQLYLAIAIKKDISLS